VPAARLLVAPAFGAAALVLAVGLRILQLGQPFAFRTGAVLVLAAIGGLAGTVAGQVWTALAGRTRLPRAILAVTLALVVAGGMAGGMALAFSVYDRLILWNLDESEGDHAAWMEILWSLGSGGYVFLTSGWRYLLPWPLPLAALATAWTVLRTMPRRD
jgi:lysylphosphatidylglycerol synthetase-like protein (DUF2156 family)